MPNKPIGKDLKGSLILKTWTRNGAPPRRIGMNRYKPWNTSAPCFYLWVVALVLILALPSCGGYSSPSGGGTGGGGGGGGGGTPDFFLFTANGGGGNTSAFLASGTSGALTGVAGSPFAAGGNPFSAAA